MPIISNTIKTFEKKIKIDNKRTNTKSPKFQNKSKNISSVDQNDIPDWIKDDQKVAAELVRQSVRKFSEDMNMFHEIVHSFAKVPFEFQIFPGFTSDLNSLRSKIETACREKLGDENFEQLFKFVKENWSDNR